MGQAESNFIFYMVVWAVGGGIVAGLIWDNKGGSFVIGFIMGALLGILGVILAAAMKPDAARSVPVAEVTTRECPHCKEQMKRDASVCPHCQRDSEPWKFHEGRWWVQRNEGWYHLDAATGQWVLTPGPQAAPRS